MVAECTCKVRMLGLTRSCLENLSALSLDTSMKVLLHKICKRSLYHEASCFQDLDQAHILPREIVEEEIRRKDGGL